eukprot:3677591-Pyramimonas_sp.AAC.1
MGDSRSPSPPPSSPRCHQAGSTPHPRTEGPRSWSRAYASTSDPRSVAPQAWTGRFRARHPRLEGRAAAI